jgi:membrane carboxypeptidase/penicillin-binding protein
MQNKRKVKVTGSMGGIPIWVNFMKEALIHEPVKDFPIPPNIEFVKIDPKTGFVYNDNNNSIEKMSIAIKTGTPLRQPLTKIENDLN